MLLPTDMREWLPEDHLVHFVIEAVEGLKLTGFQINWRGSGSEQISPLMMLTLLIYCYATKRMSSRAIEAATYGDVAVRYLCGDRIHPDHSTICEFRRQNRALLEETFVKVLELAREMKVLKAVGTVAVDGSKVLANASKHSAVSYQRAGEMIEDLRQQVQELMALAEEADSRALNEGLNVPAEIARRQDRIAALEKARALIEERAREKAAMEQVKGSVKNKARSAKDAANDDRQSPPDAPKPKDQYNFTDSESRIMKAGNGQHFEQSYNAQAAVDADSRLVVGQRVINACNDKEQLKPDLDSIPSAVYAPAAVLADSGFYSESQVAAVERAQGVPTGIVVYAAVDKQSHHKTVADLRPQPEPDPLPPEAQAKEKMSHRLKTQEGRDLYKLRKQTVEPVFGIIKEAMGFRRFSLRGLTQASLEWTLVMVSYNLRRLFTVSKQQNLTIPTAATGS